jgi:hypothetical protein
MIIGEHFQLKPGTLMRRLYITFSVLMAPSPETCDHLYFGDLEEFHVRQCVTPRKFFDSFNGGALRTLELNQVMFHGGHRTLAMDTQRFENLESLSLDEIIVTSSFINAHFSMRLRKLALRHCFAPGSDETILKIHPETLESLVMDDNWVSVSQGSVRSLLRATKQNFTFTHTTYSLSSSILSTQYSTITVLRIDVSSVHFSVSQILSRLPMINSFHFIVEKSYAVDDLLEISSPTLTVLLLSSCVFSALQLGCNPKLWSVQLHGALLNPIKITGKCEELAHIYVSDADFIKSMVIDENFEHYVPRIFERIHCHLSKKAI